MTKKQLEFFNLARNCNFDYNIQTHYVVRQHLQERLQELEDSQLNSNDKTKHEAEIDIIKNYLNELLNNAFVKHVSILEEYSLHFVRLDNKKFITDNKSNLERFKAGFRLKGVDLGKQPYQKILDAWKVRSCLLHANGRVDLVKDPQSLKQTVDKINKNKQLITIKVQFDDEKLKELEKEHKVPIRSAEWVQISIEYLHDFDNECRKLINVTDETAGI